jgi:hypothetical protein
MNNSEIKTTRELITVLSIALAQIMESSNTNAQSSYAQDALAAIEEFQTGDIPE